MGIVDLNFKREAQTGLHAIRYHPSAQYHDASILSIYKMCVSWFVLNVFLQHKVKCLLSKDNVMRNSLPAKRKDDKHDANP
jgi:hypothetical protein